MHATFSIQPPHTFVWLVWRVTISTATATTMQPTATLPSPASAASVFGRLPTSLPTSFTPAALPCNRARRGTRKGEPVCCSAYPQPRWHDRLVFPGVHAPLLCAVCCVWCCDHMRWHYCRVGWYSTHTRQHLAMSAGSLLVRASSSDEVERHRRSLEAAWLSTAQHQVCATTAVCVHQVASNHHRLTALHIGQSSPAIVQQQ